MSEHNEWSPAEQAAHLRSLLTEVITAARRNIGTVSDPKAQALFETTAEVCGGLCHAYDDYAKREPAWR
ncbi:hypothetical protein [Nocardia sp. NPDC058666]|uniref:hypothetical protein n=1 Tax=unclassified Nocardia TaxID=2637762 RepID=UPI00365EF28C